MQFTTLHTHMNMIHDQPWHFCATLLPGGGSPQDWWIAEGKLSRTAVPNARTLPGCFAMPGMVDAHTHLSMSFDRFGKIGDATAEVVQANLQDKLRRGVLAVRDTGVLPHTPQRAYHESRMQVLTCGNLNAPAGRFHSGIYVPVDAEHLVESALREVERGLRWVKIIADFPGPDYNFFDPLLNYPINVIQHLCAAVHAAGARVAAHISGPRVGDLVAAGIDSIEHGCMMTGEVLSDMAARGTAWVPTLTTVTRAVTMMVQSGAPFAPFALRCIEQLKQTIPLADQLGVPVLVGTDEHPGDYVDEVKLLCEFGLSRRAALAGASSIARSYLGLSGITDGAPAHLVLFERDPRDDLDVLANPTAIIANGTLN